MLRFAPLAGTALLIASCSQSSPDPSGIQNGAFTVDNPSGTCVAAGNGDRAGYHSSNGTVWVPDCQNPLLRELWRVFATDSDHAYMIPRPDGSTTLQPACKDASDPLHEIVLRYRLCEPATEADVDVVNHMAIADALAVARALHRTLRFTHRGASSQLAPPTDIIDACALHSLADAPELAALCTREQRRLASGDDIGFTYEGVGATQLAQRLNELYGITASATLPCVSYADGVCDAAAQCGAWSMRRVVCAADCADPGSEVRTYCVRGGTADVQCLAEKSTGDLFADLGGGDPDDSDTWRRCTPDEQAAFDAARR